MSVKFELWAAGLIIHDGDMLLRKVPEGDYDLPYEAVRAGEKDATKAAIRLCGHVGLQRAEVLPLGLPRAYYAWPESDRNVIIEPYIVSNMVWGRMADECGWHSMAEIRAGRQLLDPIADFVLLSALE